MFFERREQKDIEPIQQVIGYVDNPACLSVQLLIYFGEQDSRPWGKCSHCNAIASIPLAQSEAPGLTEKQIALIVKVRQERHIELAQFRQLARFLCGLPSPATARHKLKMHPDFGALSNFSFRKVVDRVERAQ